MPVLIQGGASGGGGTADGSAAVSFLPSFVTGGVLRNQGYIGAGNFQSSVASTANISLNAFYTPWQYTYKDSAIEKIACAVQAAQPSALGKVAIYPVSSNGAPGTRLWTSGNLDFSTTGVKEAAVTGVNLTYGQWIYCAVCANITGVTLYAHNDATMVTPVGIWDDGRLIYIFKPNAGTDFASALPTSPTGLAGDPGNWRFFFALKPTPV